MTWPIALTVIYCSAIVLGSLAGGWLPLLVRYTHLQMQVILSFVGALMLGVGVFHLLPHGIAVTDGNTDLVVLWAMFGLLVMFFLIRAFHFHQHDTDDCELQAAHDHTHGDQQPAVHRYSWLGVALGLSLHTLIDGIALGAAVMVDSDHSAHAHLPGVAIFLAILLHKPLDALSITTLMTGAGWDVRTRQLVNLSFAMMCPLGTLCVILGLSFAGSDNNTVLGCALGFSAGVFLCISLGDLLPEVHFHRHDRVKLSLALLLGVVVAYGIRLIEPAHLHSGDADVEHSHLDSHHGHEKEDQ